MDWHKFIKHISNERIREEFPLISQSTIYAWKGNRRKPELYLQSALATLLRRKRP
jgi:hypothetical protein